MSDNVENKLNKNRLLAYLLAGGSIGGGAALTAGLIKMLTNNASVYSNTEDDDDTLYISKKAGFTEGVGLGLATSSAIGAFILGDNLIDYIRKKQAQQVLDEAQVDALSAQGFKVVNKNHKTKGTPQISKTASSGLISGIGTWTGALGALLMLTGGVAAYHYLDNEYPINTDKFTPKGPKKIKVVDSSTINSLSDDQEAEDALVDKVVDANMEKLNKKASVELPAFMLYSGPDKVHSMAANVINTVANGNGIQFTKQAEELGFARALNLVKGAAYQAADPVAESLAVLYCTKEASFAPQFNLLVASEFATFNPGIMKQAACLTPQQYEVLDIIEKQAKDIFNLAIIRDLKFDEGDFETFNKVASVSKLNGSVLLSYIDKVANSFINTNEQAQTATNLSGGGEAYASKKDKELIKEEAKKYKEAMKNKDQIIDQIDDQLQQVQQQVNL